ncbi:MAG: hemin uptake protein HemP [Pseudomonadota bacterium]
MSLAMPMSHTLSLPRSASPAQPDAPTCMAAAPQPCVSSNDILRGQKAVEITHNGSTYRLQATRLGKLILTK